MKKIGLQGAFIIWVVLVVLFFGLSRYGFIGETYRPEEGFDVWLWLGIIIAAPVFIGALGVIINVWVIRPIVKLFKKK